MQLPLVWLSQAITKLLKRGKTTAEISREEITALTTAGQRLGVIEEDETRVVANLFRLPHITAKEVMTPRTVIEHVAFDATIASVVEDRETFAFSRLIVTGETVDDVSGFVLVRELLVAALNGGADRNIGEFVRELPHVSENIDLDTLLDFLMGRDAHIALVEDSYGGTAGLVTMEDVLETLLGSEIVDEHDEAIDMRQVARKRARQRDQKSS